MYVNIKENELLSWCEKPYLDYEFVDIDYSTFDQSKYEVKKGRLTDISKTDGYKKKATTQENIAQRTKLQSQIEKLDMKRVRAICEPEIKDAKTGQTWLEYYTQQIQDYREQLEKLKMNGENYAPN